MNWAAAAEARRVSPVSRAQRVQIGLITLAAIALIFVLNEFSGRRPLSPVDFVVGGDNALQFCDPANPQFLPVVSKRSPVLMRVEVAGGPGARASLERAGEPSPAKLWLRTSGGKSIGKDDLQPTEGRRLRLFLVDAALDSFEEAAPEPAPRIGEWIFSFARVPGRSYRAFADFTPRATGREMYASAEVADRGVRDTRQGLPVELPATPRLERVAPNAPGTFAGLYQTRFSIRPAHRYARQAVTVTLRITRADGAAIAGLTGPADLIGFDQGVTGLLEVKAEPTAAPSSAGQNKEISLSFHPTFADPGHYVLWAQAPMEKQAVVARMDLDVLP